MRWLLVFCPVLFLGGAALGEEEPTRYYFAVVGGGKVTGRVDVGLVKRDNQVFLVSGFFPGSWAIKNPGSGKPTRRAYAELENDGTLGKYKRWDNRGKGYRYWMAFVFEGKVKIRYEKGVGDKGRVKDVAEATAVRPLDTSRPELAWLLLGLDKETQCVGVNPQAFGKARVEKTGEEGVQLLDGRKLTLTHWRVTGDCGNYDVFTNAKGEPVVIQAQKLRYERLP